MFEVIGYSGDSAEMVRYADTLPQAKTAAKKLLEQHGAMLDRVEITMDLVTIYR